MAKSKTKYPYLLVLALIAALAYYLLASPEVADKPKADSVALASEESVLADETQPLAANAQVLALPPALEIPDGSPVGAVSLSHIGYTVSYNPELRIPNWVAYELTAEETIGSEERTNHFKPDPLLEGDAVVTRDYSNSGYDRGHMAPAADMRWSEQAMRESFYMTNICPQNHNLNAGDWKTLEEKVRDWANYYSHVYVCCGPIVAADYTTIGSAERPIAVPESFYKVILVEKEGDYHTIGFLMKNEAGHRKLSSYACTVDSLESLTGLDFFYALPDSLEAIAESTYDLAFFHVK